MEELNPADKCKQLLEEAWAAHRAALAQIKEYERRIFNMQMDMDFLRMELDDQRDPNRLYRLDWSWISKIVFILKREERPLRVKDLVEKLMEMGSELEEKAQPSTFISVTITQALKYERLVALKVKGVRGKYYCLPEWYEDGMLKEQYTDKIY